MSIWKYSFVFTAFFAVNCDDFIILRNLTSIDVIKGENIKLECVSNTSNVHTWWNTGVVQTSLVGIRNNTCIASGFVTNSLLYEYQCKEIGTTSVVLKNVSQIRHGEKWQCGENTFYEKSNNITVYVKVPVESVQMQSQPNSSGSIQENAEVNFKCNTSFCRPDATIFWFLRQGDFIYNITASSVQTIYRKDNNYTSAQSDLTTRFNRTFNSWNIFCTAINIPTMNAISTLRLLNVTFAPDNPPHIAGYQDNGIYKVIESREGRLSCVINGGNPLPYITWDCYNSREVYAVRGNNTVISNITWIAARDQRHCVCKSHYMSNIAFVRVNVDVLYQPSEPILNISNINVSGRIKVIQNNSLVVTCDSTSNPPSSYRWTGPNMFEVSAKTLDVSQIDTQKTGNYFCHASNTMFGSDDTSQTKNSSTITFIVEMLFPPERPVFIYSNERNMVVNSASISVIRSDTFTIYCHSNANPEPRYEWDDKTHGNSSYFNNISTSVNKSCSATNYMKESVGETRNGSAASYISIIVLYPPETPSITFINSIGTEINVTGSMKILEDTSFNLTCKSESRPKPIYTWYVNNSEKSNSGILKTMSVKRHQGGRYACDVFNTMHTTFGNTTEGSNNKSTFIDILYPAELSHPLINRSVVEGTRFTIICPVKPGNPNKTSVVWTSGNGVHMSQTANFTIANVTREDDSYYTCTVFNEMKPTDGKVTTHPKRSVFHLNVFFQARVTNFSANGLTSAYTLIIKAGDRLSLHCIVEGNPVPQITLSIQDGMPKTVFGRTEMFHEVNKATYMNAGLYSCNGSNNYTLEEPSKKDLVLIVKSLPRPYFEDANNSKVFASMHATITLQFRAHPYLDEIDRTNFTWYNKTSPLQSTDYKINIATNGLQSKLTIRNIMRTDFGDYKLHVVNSVGQFVQIYELLAKDIPDMPQNFTLIERFLSESSVTLSWQPGFNGGSQQQFILHYKEVSKLDWITIYVNDTGDPVMKFTIHELNSYTDYHIKLLSVNVEGNSNETKTLKFRTKGTYDSLDTNPNIAGTVAGSTIGGTAMIAGSLVGVWFLRKRYKKNSCNARTKITRSNNAVSEMKTIADDETVYEKIKTDTDRRDVDGVENTYEQLKPDAERETSERNEKVYEELKAEDGFDSTIPVYINLTL